MKQLLPFFLVVLAATVQTAIAQKVAVRDQQTHQPLEFVTAMSWEPKAYAVSNAKGIIDIGVFQGSDSIVFSSLGYESRAVSYASLLSEESEPLEFYMGRASFHLDDITISATRWRQNQHDVPQRIKTLGIEDVFRDNPQTAADLLTSTGEVYVQKSQLGGGSPILRGFATNRVLISVDGVRMNNAIFRSGNVQNIISIDPLTVERTEVTFGPGSVLYGSDAIGGVMSFYTQEPRFSLDSIPLVTGKALIRGSTANRERTGHLDFNLGGQKWASLTSISYSDYEDLVMGSYGPSEYLRKQHVTTESGIDRIVQNPSPKTQVPSGYDQVNVMQRIRYQPNRFYDFNYIFNYAQSSEYARYDRLLRERDGQLRSAEWYYGPQVWMSHSLSMTSTRATKFWDQSATTLAFQWFKESRHDRDLHDEIRNNRTEQVLAPTLNIDLEKQVNERHELFYGFSGTYNEVRSKGLGENIVNGNQFRIQSRYPDNARWASMAVYMRDQFKPTDKVTIQSGLRYNVVHAQAVFDTTFLPLPATETNLWMDALIGSFGVALKPSKTTQFNINLGTGFRAPNIDDIGKVFDSEPGAVVVPNPDLRPEYAYNAEAAIRQVIGKVVKADAALYFTYLNHALVRRPFQIDGKDSIVYNGDQSAVQAIQNAAFARVLGVQLGIEAKIFRGLSAGGHVNVQEGIEQLEDGSVAPARHAPPIFGDAFIAYSRERFYTEAEWSFNGEVSNNDLAPSEQAKAYLYAMDAEGNPYAPAWDVLDWKTSYQVTDAFLVVVAVENIFDRRYRPYASGISAPGRNFIATVKYAF